MADTIWEPTNTRTWWAGTDADVDIHREAYEGEIEGSFRVQSMFRTGGLTRFKSVENQTNAWRADRIGGVQVRGRRSGETLEPSRIVNDKVVIQVDVVSYVRTPHDLADDWTSPDFSAEYTAEHATAHAKTFDVAHMVQLIKGAQWVAPAALKASGAFNDGIFTEVTGFAAATTDEAKATLLVQYHKQVLATFVKRDLGASLGEVVTLVSPDWFAVLMEHNKLMNVEFQAQTGGNNFVQRRVATINGTRIIETPRFPTAGTTATPGHIAAVMGPEYNVSATEARTGMIVFLPSKGLVTVEAKGMTVDKWDDKENFAQVLDSYQMYNVGLIRGDAIAALYADA